MKKLFISHASEDKIFVRELVKYLEALKIKYWFDEQEIRSGDSIPQRINEGLRTSSHGILIFSPDYLRPDKVWTWEELWALINIESTSEERLIIPIRLGLNHAQLTELVPLIAHRLSLDFIGRPKEAASEIGLILGKNSNIVRLLSGGNIPEEGLPLSHNVPMPRPFGARFVGREPVITSLVDQLAKGREQDLSQFGALVISGIPGSGKSTIICEMTYRIGRQFSGGVYWFDARTKTTLKSSGEDIRKLLLSLDTPPALNTIDSKHSGDISRHAESQPCLIIFDAADSANIAVDLMQFIPKSGLSRIIITTRTEKFDLPIRFKPHCLTSLDFQSCSEILLQFRNKNQNDGQLQVIADICHTLGYLPLALQLAAGYLGRHSLSLSDYLGRLRERGPSWKGLSSTIQTIPSVVEVLSQCIEDIGNHGEVGRLAKKILQRCAAIDLVQGALYCWESEDTSSGTLQLLPLGLAAAVGVDRRNEDATDQFDEAIQILEQVGLVRLNSNSTVIIWIHSLTLQFLRDRLDAEDAKYLSFRFHVEWSNTRRLMSRCGWVDYFDEIYLAKKCALPLIKQLSPDAALDSLMTFYEMADFSDQLIAEKIVDEAIACADTLDGNPSGSALIVQLRIAKAYSVYKANRLADAENLYIQLSAHMSATGARTDQLADYLFYFGCLQLELGNDQRRIRACKLWDQAIEILIDELALMESEKTSAFFVYQLKLRLIRLFQAWGEQFPEEPRNIAEASMVEALISELEPQLGSPNSWDRQLLRSRGPLHIKMMARAVRRVLVNEE